MWGIVSVAGAPSLGRWGKRGVGSASGGRGGGGGCASSRFDFHSESFQRRQNPRIKFDSFVSAD